MAYEETSLKLCK